MPDDDFFERLKHNPRPVVVDFWAPWCAPCRMMEPVLSKLGKQYLEQVDVWKINADEQPGLLKKLKIYNIPTLVGFNAGQEIYRHTGAGSSYLLQRVFDAALSGEKPAQTGPSLQSRVWRITIGGVLVIFGYTGGFHGLYLLLVLLGVIVILSAVYDTFSIWYKIKAFFQRKP